MTLKLTEEEAGRLRSHMNMTENMRGAHNTQKITPLRALTIKNLYKAGLSKRQICITMRCGRATVNKAIKGYYK